MPKLAILLAPTVALTMALVPAAALAKVFKLGTDPAVATITLPDSWEGDGEDGEVEALTPDKTVYLSASTVDATDLKAAGQEVAKLLAEHKIELKQETRKVAPVTISGMPGAAISWDATDPDGATQVHLVTLKATPEAEIVVLRWGDADAEKDHAAEIEGIVKSLAPAK